MIAREIISDSIPPLKTSDTGQQALNWMNEFLVRHLPIVNNTQLLGLISDDNIMDMNDLNEPIGNYPLKYTKPCIKQTAHLLDALRLFEELKISLIPVCDDDKNYLGVITLQSLLDNFANYSSIREPGGIIILQMAINDYSLSEIARIVESCYASILTLFTTNHRDSTKLEVILKINRIDVSDVIATFERFNYTITGYYHKSDMNDFLKDRYDSLMNYLNT